MQLRSAERVPQGCIVAGGSCSPIIASKAPGIFKTRMAWASPTIVVIIEHEKIAIRRIRSPEDIRTSLRIQSGAMTRMRSDTVSATRHLIRDELWRRKARRTRYLGDANGFPKHTLDVFAVFPRVTALFADPEHLGHKKHPLKEKENGDPWGCYWSWGWSDSGVSDTLTEKKPSL